MRKQSIQYRSGITALLVATLLALCAPAAHAADYVVQPGDTINRIAHTAGVAPEAIVQANNLQNADAIFVGQSLLIPDASAGTAAPLPPANSAKGLAMATYPYHSEDLDALNVSWWYMWDWCNAPGCVPMVREMQMPSSCPAALLVGNEPNAIEPYGAPMAPSEAAARVLAIESTCPATRLVVGNVSYDDWSPVGGWGSGRNWLRQFLRDYRAQSGHSFRQAIGVHCYSQDAASRCINGLSQLRGLYGGPMWVTEFGILSGNTSQFSRLLNYVAGTFDRYAAFTNRQPHTGDGWKIATGVELVNGDGTLTPSGLVYVQK